MNPIGDDTLKSTMQIRLEISGACLTGVALALFVIAGLHIIEISINSPEKISPFWYWVSGFAFVTILVVITGLSEKIGNRWPYKVEEGNTNVYLLNDAHRVELAKPGLYWGTKKRRLFKIELNTTRRAQFIISGGYLCYASYQVKFYYYPPPEQVELFLAWLKELDGLKLKGQRVVIERLQKDSREDNYPFKLSTTNEVGIVF
ncbi:MAG: hypothetical protein A2611_04030 [Candidatus Komeilibacteria bacterium RIFOXYD1_FULL_37_29]|nr:MAG: hypothetical protein A2611_04030 [Candidatus Komeilibacteria bacterium RIFOXYD1_FULL_37_29]